MGAFKQVEVFKERWYVIKQDDKYVYLERVRDYKATRKGPHRVSKFTLSAEELIEVEGN